MQYRSDRHARTGAARFQTQAAPSIGKDDLEQLNARVEQIAAAQAKTIDVVLQNGKAGDNSQIQIQHLSDRLHAAETQLKAAHSEIRKLKDSKHDPVANALSWIGVGMVSASVLFAIASNLSQSQAPVTTNTMQVNQERIYAPNR